MTSRRSATVVRRGVVVLSLTGLVASCAPPPVPAQLEPEPARPLSPAPPVVVEPLAGATAALQRNDFESAARLLRPFVETCGAESVRTRHRATLLLAVAELDVANPSGSPDSAATLAALLIRDRDVPDEEAAVARALYRLALDQGAAAEGRPREYRRCSTADMNAPAGLDGGSALTTHDRLRALHDSLAARTDSIGALQAAIARSEARVRELEAELERIRRLLKGGTPRS